jgi:16S rRNA (guanine527-N7)-methyltransferase
MTLLMELCAPLLKVDGLMIALKGRNGNIELDQASQAMKILGMKLEQEKAVTIEDAEHLNFYFRKVRSTPKKYPRNYGQMKKKPLGE